MRKMYSQKQIERIALNIVENDDGFSDWLGDLINEHIADWVVENEIPIASIYDEEELVGFIVESSDGYLSSLETTEDDAGKVLGVDENGDPALLTISGGTKLYKHLIDITCENDDSFEFYIINSSNEEITECEMSIGMDYLSASVDLNNEEWNDMPVYIRFAVETTLVIQCGGTDFESISNVSSITDEISPL